MILSIINYIINVSLNKYTDLIKIKGTVMNKYNELYNRIKNEIVTGQLAYGAKLPSIRKSSELFSVSRTTVQNAYFALSADGYIISEPQSGYYVCHRITRKNAAEPNKKEKKAIYDFSSSSADRESFDFNLWRRYIKSALRQDERLLSYSEPQGEPELREALSSYILSARNITAGADRIVIGAGVQSLLSVLCSLIEERETVSFPDKSFVMGAGLFKDYGFEVHYRDKDAKIIYVSPSHMTKWGDVMPNKRRAQLVRHSAETGSLIIEDDYESDFLYNSRPTPSLHTLAGGSSVVYLGSFSKLLLPSIRISFMVLTEELAQKYRESIAKYSQTASKTEQLALCSFIRDGHLKSQIRKTRRFYTAKARQFASLLQREFDNAEIQMSENALQVIMKIPFDKSERVFEENSIKVYIENYENGIITLVLNAGSIPESKLENAVSALKKAIKN